MGEWIKSKNMLILPNEYFLLLPGDHVARNRTPKSVKLAIE